LRLAAGLYAGLIMDGFKLARKALGPILARLVIGAAGRWL
jgi:hypothetical protein